MRFSMTTVQHPNGIKVHVKKVGKKREERLPTDKIIIQQ